MTQPFKDARNDEDLHQLMAIAVLCGQRGVVHDMLAIYEAWSAAYPEDALGGIGRGLAMIRDGQPEDGLMMLERTAQTSRTRTEQARDVLTAVRRDYEQMAG